MSSAWERNPERTLGLMLAEIARDRSNGYITDSEAGRLRIAAKRCYLKAVRKVERRKDA